MFEDVSRIGKGTYGTVYRAQLHDTHETVALKQIDLTSAAEGVPCTALREIAVLQNLHHENIVWLIMVYHNSKYLTLVFEYCEYDLSTYMATHSNCLTPEEVISFSYQLLLGISAMHSKSIIHRDLKPQNLLITDQKILKICDFGLARVMDVPHDELSLDVVTLWYRPPEILLRNAAYDLSVDVWSAGCVIVEMATSMPLFRCDSESDQLSRIFGTLGIPEPSELAEMGQNIDIPLRKDVVQMPPVREVMRGCDARLIDLAESLLKIAPGRRMSAAEALRHPVFEGMRQ
jgi:serine/threonine protein kinase